MSQNTDKIDTSFPTRRFTQLVNRTDFILDVLGFRKTDAYKFPGKSLRERNSDRATSPVAFSRSWLLAGSKVGAHLQNIARGAGSDRTID